MKKGAPQYPPPRYQIPRRQQRPPLRQPTAQEIDNYRRQAVRDLTDGRCPDFDLALLKEYSPDLLLRDSGLPEDERREQLKRLTLTLALAFNDCKDVSWALIQLTYGQPRDLGNTNYAGQWRGMRAFLLRTLMGFLAELVKALEMNRGVLDSQDFKDASKRILPEYREAWDELVETVLKRGESGKGRAPLTRFLVNLRDRLSFHYADPDPNKDGMRRLAGAYDQKFRRPVDSTGKFAYASLGETMEQSRFYFADAAVLVVIEEEMKKAGVDSMDRVFEFFRTINFALRFVVEGLLEHLAATRVPPSAAEAVSGPRP